MAVANTPGLWVHYGCGFDAPEEWINFDASPTLTLQKIPLFGRFVPTGAYGRFPANVRHGDIVKGLPLPDGSAELLYCSHVLEHLSLADLRTALRNSRRIVRSGGTFRLVLPDLERMIRDYCAEADDAAAIRFMQATLLGQQRRSRGLIGFARQWLGNSHHLWMWDYRAMKSELEAAGFGGVRRAQYGDAAHQAFALVENKDRWTNCLGIECG
jgi:hypothetical protein